MAILSGRTSYVGRFLKWDSQKTWVLSPVLPSTHSVPLRSNWNTLYVFSYRNEQWIIQQFPLGSLHMAAWKHKSDHIRKMALSEFKSHPLLPLPHLHYKLLCLVPQNAIPSHSHLHHGNSVLFHSTRILHILFPLSGTYFLHWKTKATSHSSQ